MPPSATSPGPVADHADSVLFEALIVPHRSLSANGRRWLALALAGLCGLIALRFWFLGAWPIIGFSVVEIAAVIFLIYLNGRRARGSELVMLSTDTVRVVRTTPSGKRSEVVLSSAWLNVVLEETAGRVPRLLLGLRSRRVEIGSVLGDAEKRNLATALRAALYEARHPTFDNAHLEPDGIRPRPGPST